MGLRNEWPSSILQLTGREEEKEGLEEQKEVCERQRLKFTVPRAVLLLTVCAPC